MQVVVLEVTQSDQPDPSLNQAIPALYSFLYDPQGSVSQVQAVYIGTPVGFAG